MTDTIGRTPIRKIGYVRFGNLPSTGISKNNLTEESEIGVSVYEAIERDGIISVLLPRLTESACVSLSGVLSRQAHWVDGHLVGYGSDGEPLLADCKIICDAEVNAPTEWRTNVQSDATV